MKKSTSLFIAIVQMTSLMAPSLGHASRSADIVVWENITAPSGYVLSKDLYYNRNCSQIWEKQVPEFQKKNPKVEDPDVIAEGTAIVVQRCSDSDLINLSQNSDKNGQKSDSVPTTPVKPVVMHKVVNSDSSHEEDDNLPEPYIHIYGGFLSEKTDSEADPMLGIGVSGDVLPFLGYNLRINGASSVITMHNEVRFKTMPGKTRGHMIIGLGNRIGLKNKDMDRLNKGVDSFTYGGFGVEFNPSSKYRLLVDVTGNIGKRITPNFGVSAQKRLGADTWLGVYADYYSTRSVVDDNEEDRRCLTGGLKLSF